MAQQQHTAIVTGASRGLGAVIARVLAGRGADLVLNAREEAPLLAISEALTYAGGRVVPIPGDITSPLVRQRIVDEAATLGSLDIVINNASELGTIEPLAEAHAATLARVLATNLIAPLSLTQLVLPHLQSPRSLIVCVSSDAASGAYAGWGVYGASKAALELVTRTLAEELRERASFVIVDPGDMRTRMHQEAFPGQDISDRPLPQVTAPFWHWLFDQEPGDVNGRRFAAQHQGASWLQLA